MAEVTVLGSEKRIVESLTFPQPHWEALTPNTQRAFRLLSQQDLLQGYYLAGGTGLALHLGHRFSVDLDFFSEKSNALAADEAVFGKASHRSWSPAFG